jgi:hypothetical protein
MPATRAASEAVDLDAERLLGESALFEGCRPDDMQEVARIVEVQSFGPSEDIVREGDAPFL